LTGRDDGVREGLASEIETSLPAARVVRGLDPVVAWRGQPQALRLDHGPELIAERLMSWCADRGSELRDIQPGNPEQHAFIERFNRTDRTEVLNASVVESLEQVRESRAEWVQSDNEERPHDALAGLPPATYRARLEARSSPLTLSP
jgi:putative transposase